MRNFKKLFGYALILMLFAVACSEDSEPVLEIIDETTEVVTDTIYSFSYNGKEYDLMKLKMTWVDAVSYAVSRGGYLAEINDKNENKAIFDELVDNASITLSLTKSGDGGGASYVWIGGNDIETEGTWVWNGNNDEANSQFWLGDYSGTSVDGLYSNWGDEPDNWGTGDGQDALGFALTDWPYGEAGQWNDIKTNNRLYFIIEY